MAAQEHKGHGRFCRTVSDKECWKGATFGATKGWSRRDHGTLLLLHPPAQSTANSHPAARGLAREDVEMEMAQPLQMHHIPFSQGKFSRAQLALSLPPLVTIASRPVDPIDSSQATNTRAQEIKSPASLKRKPSNKRLN